MGYNVVVMERDYAYFVYQTLKESHMDNPGFDTKATLISDVLHGTIVLSPLEKHLISTCEFNRLHNVLQNSTAYFTFPSNRTCRFSHSLGTAKLAGDLFHNALINADPRTCKKFWSQIATEFEAMQSDVVSKFNDLVPGKKDKFDIVSDLSEPDIKKLSKLDNSLYRSIRVPGLDSRDAYNQVILVQSIRFVALLHDLGHPPFSHVTEFALEHLHSKYKQTKSLASKDSDFFVTSVDTFYAKSNQHALHEAVGLHIAEKILNTLCGDLSRVHESNLSNEEEHALFATVLICKCTLRILQSQSGIFKSLHNIVDSEFDADRLDYVQRDLLMSGISRESFRSERLVQTFMLIIVQKEFLFAPSIRALNNIEDFFTERLHLYKYVIYHHRVVKFDALMQNCVIQLADSFFSMRRCQDEAHTKRIKETIDSKSDLDLRNKTNYQTDDPIKLKPDISGLWQVFGRKLNTQFEKNYMQWDDSWLLSILRSAYFDIQGKVGHDTLKARLEELLSNRKEYSVLFKRSECFERIDYHCIKALKGSLTTSPALRLSATQLQSAKFRNAHSQIEKLDAVLRHITLPVKNASFRLKYEKVLAEHGYILSNLLSLIRAIKGPYAPMPFLQRAGVLLVNSYKTKILDVLVIPKTLKPGMSENFLLAGSSGSPIKISSVSRIPFELEKSAMFSPPFFVFILPVNSATQLDLNQVSRSFSKHLANTLDSWLNSPYDV